MGFFCLPASSLGFMSRENSYKLEKETVLIWIDDQMDAPQ